MILAHFYFQARDIAGGENIRRACGMAAPITAIAGDEGIRKTGNENNVPGDESCSGGIKMKNSPTESLRESRRVNNLYTPLLVLQIFNRIGFGGFERLDAHSD